MYPVLLLIEFKFQRKPTVLWKKKMKKKKWMLNFKFQTKQWHTIRRPRPPLPTLVRLVTRHVSQPRYHCRITSPPLLIFFLAAKLESNWLKGNPPGWIVLKMLGRRMKVLSDPIPMPDRYVSGGRWGTASSKDAKPKQIHDVNIRSNSTDKIRQSTDFDRNDLTRSSF